MTATGRTYYCSMKFKYLKIDLALGTTYNCHAASPHRVDFDWLRDNPGNLFNTSVNMNERTMMLRNERNSSCEQNCWKAEDVGSVSPRLYQDGSEITHTEIQSTPEIIDLTINEDCNLTCSYCCREFSSSWRRDLVNNGNYTLNDPRYQLTTKDRLMLKISQSELKETSRYRTLLNEIKLAAPNLKKLIITGGEPFLDNKLTTVLQELDLSENTRIEIYTGMGVSYTRFEKILKDLTKIKNLSIIVSAESTGKYLEFNRYGANWNDFVQKINLIKEHNINMEFHSTLTNLTVFGFRDFYNNFSDDKIVTTFAYQPRMMAPYVLDTASKDQIKSDIQELPEKVKLAIMDSIAADPTEEERMSIKKFITEFVARRSDLSLDIFPKTFLQWLEL